MAPIPSEDEAAAIAAAVERFVAEASAGVEEQRPAVSPWRSAALLGGVSAKAGVVEREGGDKWLS
jgi:hypothetical protein